MLIVIANQFIGENVATGGDVLAVEVVKRIRDKKIILSPRIIHPQLKKMIPNAKLVATDDQNYLGTASTLSGGLLTLYSYIKRAVLSYNWLLKNAHDGDVLYLTGDFICNTIPAFLLKIKNRKIKILANFYHRNPMPIDRKGNPFVTSYFSRLIQTISLKFIKHSADTIFVLSEIGRKELLYEGFAEEKIKITGAGVNRTILKFKKKNRKNYIVFIGRINNTKGAFDLISIFKIVHKKFPTLKLIMMGGGSSSDISRLNALIKKNNLQKSVEYYGYVSDTEKFEILSMAKLLVLASKEEGFGIVITEALALNIPVVCYKLDALFTIFSKYPEVLFARKDSKLDFARKIIKLLNNTKETNIKSVPTWDEVYTQQKKYLIG